MAWDDSPPTREELTKLLSVKEDDLNGLLNGRYPDTGRAASSPGERTNLTAVKAQIGAVSPSIPRAPQFTGDNWDSTPPTKEEMDKINGVAPAQAQGQAQTEIRSAPSGNPIGNNDEIYRTIGGPNSSLQAAADAATGMLGNYGPQIKGKLWQMASGEGVDNNADYIKRRDAIIADEAAKAKQYPASDIIGKTAGFFAPAAATGGASVAGTLPEMAAKSAVTGGVIGGLSNPGDRPGEVDTTQLADRNNNTLTGMGVGAALPYAAAGAGKAFDYLAPKALSTFMGPSEEAIRARFRDPDSIKDAPTIAKIKSDIDDSMQGLFSAVDDGQISQKGAQRQLGIIQQEVRDATKNANFTFQVDKQETGRQLDQVQNQVNEEFKNRVSALKEQAKPPQLEPQISESLGALKSDISDLSQKSYDALDNDTKSYSVRGASKLLRSMADDMNIKGVPTAGENMEPGLVAQGYAGQAKGPASVPGGTPQSPAATAESRGVQSELRKLAGILEETPEQMPARELKKILQQIDKSEEAQYGQPGFDSRVSSAYKTVRATINAAVRKNNPEFAGIMDELAPKVQTFDAAVKRFGNTPDNPNAATQRLGTIGSRTGELDRALLANLGDQTGHDFVTPINEHMDAKASLANPDAIRSSIPKQQNVLDLQSQQDRQGRYEAPSEYVEHTLGLSALPEQQAAATRDLADKTAALEDAKNRLEPLKGLGPKSTQNSITNLMKAPDKESIEIRKRIQGLSDITGKDFGSDIERRRLANHFDGTYMNGSRNAVIGGGIGTAIGGWFGKSFESAGIGGMIGKAAGGAVDRQGRAMAGGIVDAANSLSKTKTAQMLLQVPTYASIAKNYPAAFAGLVHAVSGGQAPLKGADKWAADGLNKLNQHAGQPSGVADSTLMANPKVKDLLIQASDLKPGTKAMDKVMTKIRTEVSGEDD